MRRSAVFVLVICATLLLSCFVNAPEVLGQSNDEASRAEAKDNDINLDTQLYLIIGSNQPGTDEKMPAMLEPVLKQLRSSLPFKSYRVSATLINRVKNGGRLNLKWISGPLIEPAASTSQTPSFNEFRINPLRIVQDAEGRAIVRLEQFSFGARIPIQTGMAVAANAPSAPIINYESTGLTTDISMREGEPVIVGTLNAGPSGEAIILVMSAKRALR
jgi:hypothetical protein